MAIHRLVLHCVGASSPLRVLLLRAADELIPNEVSEPPVRFVWAYPPSLLLLDRLGRMKPFPPAAHFMGGGHELPTG